MVWSLSKQGYILVPILPQKTTQGGSLELFLFYLFFGRPFCSVFPSKHTPKAALPGVDILEVRCWW